MKSFKLSIFLEKVSKRALAQVRKFILDLFSLQAGSFWDSHRPSNGDGVGGVMVKRSYFSM